MLRGEALSIPDLAIGDLLVDRYRIESVIKAGGMGVVVAARHVALGQRVAIKLLLHRSSAQEGVKQRFIREARAAALLRSEHVVGVSDVGTLPNGVPFMVMEFLEGS